VAANWQVTQAAAASGWRRPPSGSPGQVIMMPVVRRVAGGPPRHRASDSAERDLQRQVHVPGALGPGFGLPLPGD